MHAPSSGAHFPRRTFSLSLYARSLVALMTASPVLVRALNRPRISPALRQQIMLAVTSVNDCRYCNWGHTALALRNGVDLTARRQTLDSGSSAPTARPTQSPSCTLSTSPASRVMLTRARSGRLRVPGLRMSRPRSRRISRRSPSGTWSATAPTPGSRGCAGYLSKAGIRPGRRSRLSGRMPGAPVSVGMEPHAGIRGDRLAMSSSGQSLHDSPRRGTPHDL
jgi:AhpD family alkylhydroperoxidase